MLGKGEADLKFPQREICSVEFYHMANIARSERIRGRHFNTLIVQQEKLGEKKRLEFGAIIWAHNLLVFQ